MKPPANPPRGSLSPIAAALFGACGLMLPLMLSAASSARSVAGVWDSKFGAVTLEEAAFPGGTMAVRGYHDESPGHRADIRDGTFDPATGVLVFTYFQGWRNLTGTGRFTLATDGTTLSGTFQQPGSSGAWTLTRRGGAPAPAMATVPSTAPPATPRSVAGPWNSKLGAVTLQETARPGAGPVAVAGFHDESREHRAELRDGMFDPATGTLVFTYVQPWRNVTGTARFVLSADNQKLTGTYSQPGATGPWTLERAGAGTSATGAPATSTPSSGAQLALALAGALLGPSEPPAGSAPGTQPSATPATGSAQGLVSALAGALLGETAPRGAAVSSATPQPAPVPAAGLVTGLPDVPRGGLVGEWLFGGDTNDTSGRGFHGKSSGGATLAPDRSGRDGSALRFNGTNAKLDCGTLPGVNLTPQATISVWVKLEGRPGYWHIAGKAGGGTDFDLIVDGGAIRFYIAGGTNYTSRRKLPEGEWTHVAASFRAGGKLKVYLNGELDGAIDIGARNENGNPFTVGESGAWPGRWFKGVLDDLRLYDRQLSDAEVLALSRERGGSTARSGTSSPSDAFEQGKQRLGAGDYRGADDAFTRAIQANPNHADAYRERARTHNRLQDYQAGKADADRAIALNPADAVAFNLRGNARNRLGDTAGAIADYSQAITLDPRYASAFANRGTLRLAAKDYPAARRDYEQALAIAPRDVNALWGRGTVKAQSGDPAGALADYDQALAVDPRNAGVLNNRGQALYQLRRSAEALESLNQALAINPKYPTALANRAMTRADLGDATGSLADLDEAMKLDPAATQAAVTGLRSLPRAATPPMVPAVGTAGTSPPGQPSVDSPPLREPVAARTPLPADARPATPTTTTVAATAVPSAAASPAFDLGSFALPAPLRTALLASPALAMRERRGAILFRPTGNLQVVSERPAPGGGRKLEILADGERRASPDAPVEKTSLRVFAVIDWAEKGIEVTSTAMVGPDDDELIRLVANRR